MNIKKIILDFLDTNCYFVESGALSFLIDPGSDFKKIKNYLNDNDKKPHFILNTHAHFDHIGAVNELIDYYKIPFYIHENDEEVLLNSDKNMSSFFQKNKLLFNAYNLILGEKVIDFYNAGIDIYNLPGHTPGSIIIKISDVLFTGDILFKGSVGRTDLPCGNSKKMKESIEKIKEMDDKLRIMPGHGPDSVLSYEFLNNIFLLD